MNEDLTIATLSEWLQTRQNLSDSRQLLILSDADTHKNEVAEVRSVALQHYLNLVTKHHPDALYVNNTELQNNFELPNRLNYSQIQAHLGKQYSAVILDCREGWLPNHLYAASGLIQASGILVLVTPPPAVWTQYYAQQSMVRFSYGDCHQNSFFASYVYHSFLVNNTIAWHSPQETRLPIIKDNLTVKPSQSSASILLSEKQHNIVQTISKSWVEHSESCHYISGARGRGKSTVLAKLCELVLFDNKYDQFTQIAICAPSKAQRDIITEYMTSAEQHKSKLLSIAPDQAERLTRNTLLIIDEAASIAPNLLTQLCDKTQHSILCATTQGYEGSGKGLIYRWLPSAKGTINTYSLTAPFRWRDNDALEATMESLFEPTLPILPHQSPKSFNLHLLKKHTLSKHTPLLKGCIALLQQAHYQSTPSDILRMLDAEDHQIWAYTDASNPTDSASLMGVICTIAEGGKDVFEDPSLCEKIATGNRRVQGHMSVQAIASAIHQPAVLTHRTCRIHRIAVRPDYQGINIGSEMLACLHQQRSQLNMDGFSTSFGLTKRLENFWHKNGYVLTKIGHRKDTSSGSITGHYLHKRSALYKEYASLTRAHVIMDIEYLQAYRRDIALLLPSPCIVLGPQDELSLRQLVQTKLMLFSKQLISYAMAKPAIFAIIKQANQLEFETCFNQIHQQHLSKTAKQALLNELKMYVNRWLQEQ